MWIRWHLSISAYSTVGLPQPSLMTRAAMPCRDARFIRLTSHTYGYQAKRCAWYCWGCAGNLEILHLLLEHQQSQAWLRCEGSTPLHMASCLCGLKAKRQQGLEAAKLLLMSKASVFDKCAQPSCHRPLSIRLASAPRPSAPPLLIVLHM